MPNKPTKKQLYKAEWNALLNAVHRCHNPNHIAYKNYGARGITVCQEWRDKDIGLDAFLDHIGRRPNNKHSLDRIDNDKGYYPGNVRWTDRKTQQNNRRVPTGDVMDFGWGVGRSKPIGPHSRRGYVSALVPFQGKLQTVCDWAHERGIEGSTIRQRLERGMTPAEALSKESYKGRHARNKPIVVKSHLRQAIDAAIDKLDIAIDAHDLFACSACGKSGVGDGSDHTCRS